MKPHTPRQQHNYVRKLRYLIRTGAIPRMVGYHPLQVDHDDWCNIWQQRFCNCNPDSSLRWSQPTVVDN
jgi:hypothetical protein